MSYAETLIYSAFIGILLTALLYLLRRWLFIRREAKFNREWNEFVTRIQSSDSEK